MSTETDTPKKETSEIKKSRVTWNEIKNHPSKRLVDYIGPTGFWLLIYYASSLFMMIVLNIARIGWSLEAIFTAPMYIAQIFINYGLNSGKVEDTTVGSENDFMYEKADLDNVMTSAAWLFAPMVVYVLGLLMIILNGAGYPQPVGDYDYLLNFQYFHQFVPFLNENKSGGFYFLIVWLPIIISTVIAAFVSKRLFREGIKQPNINVIRILLFNILVGFAVGMQLGVITGDVEFKFRGAIGTILTNDYDNWGYFFYGQYNPNSIMFTSWFINFIPLFIGVAWHALYGNIEDRILGKNRLKVAIEQMEKEEPA
ncbi:MAG: hypothetical protein FK733_09990 [Asgard group archaeon]|nr:hypothetical protein [Asgard group archaeon]